VSKPSVSFDLLLVEPAALVMLGAELCEVVSPTSISILAITGLLFPFALLAFLIGVILRLSRGYWKGMIIPIVVLCITLTSITNTVGGRGESPEIIDNQDSGIQLSLMSYNVRRMDEYNWLKGEETRRELYSWLKENKCDIMCFQEFPSNMKGRLQDALKEHSIVLNGSGAGPAIATTHTVISKSSWTFEGDSHPRGLVLDLLVENDTVRLVNVHLQSVGLARDDYDAVREGTDSEDRKRLLSRLKKAYSQRAEQALSLRKFLDSSPYKILLAGDFNDTPVSFALNTIKNSEVEALVLYDAFSVSGSGIGSTYVGDLPGLRIDYLLFSEGISAQNFRTHNIKLSDHKPISCDFSF
jgi:endonuclease/exonuclease/phosphatase family metal-dependent hydrolase